MRRLLEELHLDKSRQNPQMPCYILHVLGPSSFFNILFFPAAILGEIEKQRGHRKLFCHLKRRWRHLWEPWWCQPAQIRNGTRNEMVSVLREIIPPESTSPCSQKAPKYMLRRGLYHCSYVKAQLFQLLTFLDIQCTALYFVYFPLLCGFWVGARR